MICSACREPLSGAPAFCPFCATPLAGGVRLVDSGRDRIAVIMAVRELTGLGLKEAKDLVESAPVTLQGNPEILLRKLREAGATAETVGEPVPVAPVEERDVLLRDVGSNKILVIKIVRAATGLGLKETKDLVEAAPAVVARRDAACAERICAELRAAGATADLR